ncbi:MAG: S9 family peptidase [Bdellovibrionaceae bacterium]|nr:S9 family peptidase [Pseudobdellovibrionaceae bacterium]
MSKFFQFFLYTLIISMLGCQSKTSKANSPSSYSQFGIESVSKDDLKKYAPREIGNTTKNKLSLYLDIQSPTSARLHANGRDLFFNWRISGSQQIWKITGAMGYPVQMTGGKDMTTLMDIAPNGQFIILHRDIDGQEAPGIYIQSINGGELTKIFHEPKVRSEFQFISEDSKEIYFTSNHEDAQSFFIYKINIDSKNIEKIHGEKGMWTVMDHDGDRLLLSFLKSSFANDVYEYNLKTKEKKWLLGENKEDPFRVRFLKTPGKYLVQTLDGDFQTIKLLDHGVLKTIIKSEKFDVDTFDVSENRDFMAYELNRNGYTDLFLFRLSADGTLSEINYKISAPASIQKTDHLRILFNRTNSVPILASSSSREPRVFYSLDLNSRKYTQWTKTNAPEVQTNTFVVASLEYYKAKDGTAIPMFVRRPEKCKKSLCPVVVQFHGGPESQAYAGFNPLGQIFTENGFIYVEPNVRGSTGYGRAWMQSDNGPKRKDVVTDIQDAALWIKQNWAVGGVAPKVGIFGGSYGGYSTLMGMTYFAGAYEAGVSVVGISNLVSFLQNTAPYRRHVRETEYGFLNKDMASLTELSPITHIQNVRAPLMLIQGANDPRVPVGEAVQIQKALEKNKRQSELIIFPDEGHGSAKKENKILEWGYILEFFKKHLDR